MTKIRVCLIVVVLLALTGGVVLATAPVQEEPGSSADFNMTGYPIVDEKMTFDFVAYTPPEITQDYDDSPTLQMIEDITNIHINWETYSSGMDERANLIFASGDLPDAFFSAFLQQNDPYLYGEQGFLIPLQDLVDDYMPNFKRTFFEERPGYGGVMYQPDGNIYTLPQGAENGFKMWGAMFINRTWLDTLGLETPTTTDEFYEVLKAFKEQDPNGNGLDDEIPYIFNGTGYQGLENMNIPFTGLYDSWTHIGFDQDEAVFTATGSGYRESIEWLHMLASEGLLDNEGFSYDQRVYRAKINEGIVGVFIDWRLVNMGLDNIVADMDQLLPLEGPRGDQGWTQRVVGYNPNYGSQITSTCESPEVLARWFDWFYDPINSIIARDGPNSEINEDGETFTIINKPEDVPKNEWEWAPGVAIPHFSTFEELDKRRGFSSDMEQDGIRLTQALNPYFVDPPQNLPLAFTVDEITRMNRLNTELLQYVNERKAAWIINGGIENEWDQYLEQLDRLGVEEYTQIYNDAYQRYRDSF